MNGMPQISPENIDAAIDKIDNLNEDALDKLIETFTLSQDELVNYILQAGFEYENDELNMYSMYYFAIIYESFLQQNLNPATISDQIIEDFQEPFHLALDAIHSEEDHVPLQELLNQPHLIEFMINEIEAEDEDGDTLDEETKTQLFIVSSSIIGLLNQVTQ